MKLIVFSGLPGSGKSSLAEWIGQKLQIPVFAKDWLESSLVGSGLVSDNKSKLLGFAGYELLSLLAERQLKMQQSVILDCVTSTESIREVWRKLAGQYQAEWLVIECICSDVTLHRDRLVKRERKIPNWYELDWKDIERIKTYYEPWTQPRLVLDSVNPLAENQTLALEYCS
jgi:predicted kinase